MQAQQAPAGTFPRPIRVSREGAVDQFALGVQYYGPPQTDVAEWEQDLPRIKAHGLNVLRVWAFWGLLEPEPGRYDFAAWDRLFDAAARHGLSVLPNLVIEVQPFWAHRVWPDAHYVDQFGQRVLSTTGEYCSGLGPGVCLDHDEPRQAATSFLEAFARHFGGRANLYAWDAWCETRWTDNVNDRVLNRSLVRILCYCPATVARYRTWLERRYGSLQHLNEVWRRHYVSWADLEPPRFGWWSYAFPEMVDWRAFMMDDVTDKLALRVDGLRRGDPDHAMTMHAGAASVSSTDTVAERGSDDWRLARGVDIYGTSLYPVWGGRNPDVTSLRLDGIRSAHRGRPFWMGELQGGPSLHSPGKANNYSPQEVKFWTWVSLAHGAKGILYWSWRPEPMGPETFGFGLCLYDGTPTARTVAASDVARVIRANEGLLLSAEPTPAQAAILFDPDLYTADWAGGSGGMERGMIYRCVRGYYKALWENDIPCDLVHADYMDNLPRYRLLVLPFAFCIKPQVAKAVEAFVRGGGTVLADAYLGRFQQSLVPATDSPTYGLRSVFGVRTTEAEFVDTTDIRLGTQPLFAGMDGLRGHWFKEGLEPLEGAEVWAAYNDGAPALVAHRYGEGCTLFAASLLSLQHGEASDVSLTRLMANVASLAGVETRVTVQTSHEGQVRVRLHRYPEGYLVYCLNYGAACTAKLRAHQPAPRELRELISGAVQPCSLCEAQVEIELSLAAGEARVLLYAV